MKPEILAPVGSREALEAAVRCGADAVYLGQKSFSARADSRNFGPEELAEAVTYAHRFGVRVHQALNILAFDREFPALEDCIRAACSAGVDALIVQDWGVAAAVKALAPSMPLHASTQMAIHSPAGVRAAGELGFSRVVLARELSREEIAAIRASTSLELEVFVHGAHCMSVSGQCYLSAMLGGKSGNRGRCAQPCRLPFSAAAPGIAQAGESVLSLKDMCLIPYLMELAAMGVESFKIEGRMKRPEYVAAAVTACRAALDGREPDLDALQAVFSRSGFTSAYFDGCISREMFGFRRKEDVEAATGVLRELQSTFQKDVPRIPVEMELTLKPDQPASLTLTAEGKAVTVSGVLPWETVNPADENFARRFLSKLGGTPYFLTGLQVENSAGLSLPASGFNALRRDAVEQMDALRTAVFPRFTGGALPTLPEPARNPPISQEIWGEFQAFSQIPLESAGDFSRMLLPVPELEAHLEELRPHLPRLAAVLPRFTFSEEKQWVPRLIALRERGVTALWCSNAAQIILGRDAGMKLLGSPWLNLTNSQSLLAARQLGLSAAALSIETALSDAVRLRTDLPLGIAAYGWLPLMSLRSCPVKAQIGCAKCRGQGFLTDRKGIRFPVRCDFDRSASFLYNSVPLELAGRLDELSSLSFLLLLFTGETPEEADAVLRRYKTRQKPEGSFTRGLLYRGVE